MTELEERIVAFTAKETGMKAHRIALSSRLSHDLGIDGDDAVKFFDKYGKEFSVDLSALGDHWHQHFKPEGGGPSLGFMVVIVVCVVLGGLVHRAFNRIPGWASMIVLILVFGWAYSRFLTNPDHDAMVPVIVGDLLDAAKEGKWVTHYDEVGLMFRTLR